MRRSMASVYGGPGPYAAVFPPARGHRPAMGVPAYSASPYQGLSLAHGQVPWGSVAPRRRGLSSLSFSRAPPPFSGTPAPYRRARIAKRLRHVPSTSTAGRPVPVDRLDSAAAASTDHQSWTEREDTAPQGVPGSARDPALGEQAGPTKAPQEYSAPKRERRARRSDRMEPTP